MSPRSVSERTKSQPFEMNVVFISVPWSMPISRNSLPSFFIHFFAFFAIAWYAASPLFVAYNAILGSWVAPMSTRGSLWAIYGGFETIISNRSL